MGENKLLRPLWGRPLLAWSLESALSSGCTEVVVVLGHEAEKVREVLPTGVKPVLNPEWEAGISTSIRRGIREVSEESDAAVIMVADQPLTPPVVPAMLASLVLHGGYLLACASVGGSPRNPAAFHRRLFSELLELSGDEGARSVILRHLSAAALLEVPEEALVDVDTPEELSRLEKTARSAPGRTN